MKVFFSFLPFTFYLFYVDFLENMVSSQEQKLAVPQVTQEALHLGSRHKGC